jgi:uncharacterized protein (TIGR00369 family)
MSENTHGSRDDFTPLGAGRSLPDGWELIDSCGAFTAHVGPIYMRYVTPRSNGEAVRFGFFVQPLHCNPSGNCHGGMLATFLDIALGRTGIIARGVEARTPTINLEMSFLRPAKLGDWIESQVRLVHTTSRLGFCEGCLVGPQGPILRGSGVFRIPRAATTEAGTSRSE